MTCLEVYSKVMRECTSALPPISLLAVSVAQVAVHYGLDVETKSELTIHCDSPPSSLVTYMFINWNDLNLWGGVVLQLLAAWAASYRSTSFAVSNLSVLAVYFISGAVAGAVTAASMLPANNCIAGSLAAISGLHGLCLVEAGAWVRDCKASSGAQVLSVHFALLVGSVFVAVYWLAHNLVRLDPYALGQLAALAVGIVGGIAIKLALWLASRHEKTRLAQKNKLPFNKEVF